MLKMDFNADVCVLNALRKFTPINLKPGKTRLVKH